MDLDRTVVRRCSSILVSSYLLLVVFLFSSVALLRAQDHSRHEDHEGMAMGGPAPEPSLACQSRSVSLLVGVRVDRGVIAHFLAQSRSMQRERVASAGGLASVDSQYLSCDE